jgi:DNA-binding transcriptional regulator YiaG
MQWRCSRKEDEMSLVEEVRASRRLPLPGTARLIRLTAGVSQQRLADELGVHRMTVVRWESGERNPRGAVRARYSDLLEQLRREVS